MSDENITTIRSVYAAFGKGDVPAILATLAESATFSFAGASTRVPWHGPFRGAGEVARFFSSIAGAVAFEAFEPLAFAATGDSVAVRLHLRYRVAATGRIVDEEQVHWWTFDGRKIADMVHFEDTAQVIAAVS